MLTLSRVRTLLVLGWVLLVMPRVVHANQGGKPVRLEYSAPTSCPDLQAFLALVRARSAEFDLADDALPERAFHVEIRTDGEASSGSVRVADQAEPRSFRAARCSDVAEMLAFVIALKLDENAWAPDTAGVSPSDDAQASAQNRAGGKPQQSAALPALSPETSAPESVTTRALPIVTAHEFGGLGLGIRGPVPGWMFGGSLFAGLAFSTRARPFAPALRLSLSHGQSGEVSAGAFALRSALSRVALDLCALRFDAEPASLRACARTEIGRLSAQGAGSDEIETRTVRNLWLGVGGSAGLRVAFGETFGAELEAGALAALTRRTYVFVNPKEVAYEVPLVVPWLGLGASVLLR